MRTRYWDIQVKRLIERRKITKVECKKNIRMKITCSDKPRTHLADYTIIKISRETTM